MNVSNKKQLKMIKQSICSISKKDYKESQFYFGSGGSQTIIRISKNKNVLKYFPIFYNQYTLENKNTFVNDQIKDYKKEFLALRKLTQNIVKTKKSPHIVQLYKLYKCKNVPKILFAHCDFYKYLLKSSNKYNEQTPIECDYLYRGYPTKYDLLCYVLHLEYCDTTLNNLISDYFTLTFQSKTFIDYLKKINNEDLRFKEWKRKTKQFLNLIIFQISFTLCSIYSVYPNFIHGDLFIRNILIQKLENITYYQYSYKNKIFVVPVNFICKINDFGLTEFNQKNQYKDLFCFLYDIYNGSNLGSESIFTLLHNHPNDLFYDQKIKFINHYFNQFFNVKIINKIKGSNSSHQLDWNWNLTFDSKFVKLLNLKTPEKILKLFYENNLYSAKKQKSQITKYFGF